MTAAVFWGCATSAALSSVGWGRRQYLCNILGDRCEGGSGDGDGSGGDTSSGGGNILGEGCSCDGDGLGGDTSAGGGSISDDVREGGGGDGAGSGGSIALGVSDSTSVDKIFINSDGLIPLGIMSSTTLLSEGVPDDGSGGHTRAKTAAGFSLTILRLNRVSRRPAI